MKALKNVLLSSLLFTQLATLAKAQNYERLVPRRSDIFVTDMSYGGTGCPAGTVSYHYDPTGNNLKFALDEFHLATDERTLDRKFCGLSISVHVPEGLQVSLRPKNDLRGFAALLPGSTLSVTIEDFLAGETGSRYRADVRGPRQGFFVIDQDEIRSRWSACGEDVNARIQITGLLRDNNRNRTISPRFLQASLATLGEQNSLDYELVVRSCN